MNARIIQVTLLLMVNNAFILLAVADIDLLKFALLGGWALIFIAGVYLAMAINKSNFNARYQEQESRRRWV
tara:strand:+ start:794 stop:1006 length:213 start_codon:yes stop_codon:yes gene_type:complete